DQQPKNCNCHPAESPLESDPAQTCLRISRSLLLVELLEQKFVEKIGVARFEAQSYDRAVLSPAPNAQTLLNALHSAHVIKRHSLATRQGSQGKSLAIKCPSWPSHLASLAQNFMGPRPLLIGQAKQQSGERVRLAV